MNYSYVMGITDIDDLRKNGFNIKIYGENYGISFPDDKIKIFEEKKNHFLLVFLS